MVLNFNILCLDEINNSYLVCNSYYMFIKVLYTPALNPNILYSLLSYRFNLNDCILLGCAEWQKFYRLNMCYTF